MRCVNYALQGSVNFQEKHVDYQCLMPFAALSFDQHTKSLSKYQIEAQKDALLSTFRAKLARHSCYYHQGYCDMILPNF